MIIRHYLLTRLLLFLSYLITFSKNDLFGQSLRRGVTNPFLQLSSPTKTLLPSSTSSSTTLSYTSYQLGPVCLPSEPIRSPSSIPEIISIVQEGLRRRIPIKAFGHRHSATDIICTPGIPIDMRNIRGLHLNSHDKSITVGAGVYLRELCKFAEKHGRGFKTIPSFGQITIGGAIGTGAHGSSIKHASSISAQVIALTIVDGTGQLRKISKMEDLVAFRVHLGLLGIIVDVTISTSPLYKVIATNYIESDAILTNGVASSYARTLDQVSLYWFPSLGQVVVANWTILDDVSIPGDAYTFDHVPSTSVTYNAFATRFFEFAQSIKSVGLLQLFESASKHTLISNVPDFLPIYTEDGLNVLNPAIGIYHQMFAPICHGSGWFQCPWFHAPDKMGFVDNEISLDLASLPSFIAEAKGILNQYPAAFPMQGLLLRFSSASNNLMSPSFGRDSVHVEWYMGKREDPYHSTSTGLGTYQALMQTMIRKYNGRSHWGKSGLIYHSKDILASKFPSSVKSAFVTKMKQYDPYGVFLNDFGRRFIGTGARINVDPLTQHCALLDNCFCRQDVDCAPEQKCRRINGYPVCATKFSKSNNVDVVSNLQLLSSLPSSLLAATSSSSFGSWMIKSLF